MALLMDAPQVLLAHPSVPARTGRLLRAGVASRQGGAVSRTARWRAVRAKRSYVSRRGLNTAVAAWHTVFRIQKRRRFADRRLRSSATRSSFQ